jgi:hypothetical protein
MHLGMSFQSNHWRQHQYVATIKMPTSNTPYNNINLASRFYYNVMKKICLLLKKISMAPTS